MKIASVIKNAVLVALVLVPLAVLHATGLANLRCEHLAKVSIQVCSV